MPPARAISTKNKHLLVILTQWGDHKGSLRSAWECFCECASSRGFMLLPLAEVFHADLVSGTLIPLTLVPLAFAADIPADPRHTELWPFAPVYSGAAGERGDQGGGFKYAEGTAAADIDGDGIVDLLAGIMFSDTNAGFNPVRFYRVFSDTPGP